MTRAARAFVLIAGLAAGSARAEAPLTSPRPMPRPVVFAEGAAVEAAIVSAALATSDPPISEFPHQDPVSAFLQTLTGTRPAAAAAAPVAGISALAVARSLRPRHRPFGFEGLIEASATPRASSRGGSVCGVAAIMGEAIAPIHGAGACGVAAPVRITSVAGIPLSMQPTIDCPTAIALNDWVRDGVLPTIGRTGGGVARVNVIAHYSCRTRNNQPGTKLSEHSMGHALDVSGVTLHNGTTLSVEEQWRGRYSNQFRTLFRRACGPFGTVLSPDADRYHYNHFHLDTARYRGGPYCH